MRDALSSRPSNWRRYPPASVVMGALFLAGCMPVPILWPNLSSSAAVQTGPVPMAPEAAAHGVRAFRVDVSENYIGIGGGNTSKTRCTICEIPLAPSGLVPSQTSFSLDRGVFLWSIGDGFLAVSFDD